MKNGSAFRNALARSFIPSPLFDPLENLEDFSVTAANALTGIFGLILEERYPFVTGTADLRGMRHDRFALLQPGIGDIDVVIAVKLDRRVIPVTAIHQKARHMAARMQ